MLYKNWSREFPRVMILITDSGTLIRYRQICFLYNDSTRNHYFHRCWKLYMLNVELLSPPITDIGAAAGTCEEHKRLGSSIEIHPECAPTGLWSTVV